MSQISQENNCAWSVVFIVRAFRSRVLILTILMIQVRFDIVCKMLKVDITVSCITFGNIPGRRKIRNLKCPETTFS